MGVFDFFKKNKNEDPSQLHYKKHKTIGGNGVRKMYYDNGKGPLESTVNVVDGYWDGEKVYFRRDGSISSTSRYVHDLYDRDKLGSHEEKVESGLFVYLSNNIFGEMKEYYENGNIKIIANRHYTSDGKVYDFGIWQYFDSNGELCDVLDFGNPTPCEFSNKKHFDKKIKEIEIQRIKFKDFITK